MTGISMEATFPEKIQEGIAIKNRIVKSGLELARAFPLSDPSDPGASNRRAAARSFLIAASQLAGQIIDAISRGSLGLAIIGLKTLLEFDVNANYVFDHPDHQNDLNWIDDHCSDLFDKTNDLKAVKNRLGGVSVKDRCIGIGRLDLYEKNYAGLNDYAHLTLRQNFLNERTRFEKLSVDVISHALCHLVDVIDSINKHFKLGWGTSLKEEVVSYLDRFESPAE